MEGQNPTPGTPEYEAFIASKAEGVQVKTYTPDGQAVTPPSPEAERPAWLPEKFKTVEDMAKAYSELEKKQGQAPAQPQSEGGDPTSLEVQKPADLPASVSDNDFSKYSAEFAEKGALSDETYADLEKKGIPRETVDAYIEGQRAIMERRQNEGFNLVGGKEAYSQMVQWAAANLTAEEAGAFNQAVSGSWELAQIAIQGLNAKYQAAVGRAPNLVQGEGGNDGGSMAFASREEVKAAMRDPRYAKDPAYRNQVAARLRVTPDSVI